MVNFLAFIVLITSAISIPLLNTVNDVDVFGNTCPVQVLRDATCPSIICVTNINLCPPTQKPSCPNGQTLCNDGATCSNDCSTVTDYCACNTEALPNTKYQACSVVSVVLDVDNFIPTERSIGIANQCSKYFNASFAPDGTNVTLINSVGFWAEPLCAGPALDYNYTSQFALSIYGVLGGEIAIIFAWFLYKTFLERNSKNSSVLNTGSNSTIYNEKLGKAAEGKGETVQLKKSPTTLIQPYQNSMVGTFAAFTMVVTSFFLIAWLTFLVLDNYGLVVQVTPSTSYLYFGGNLDYNYKTFCVIWHIAATWFVTINLQWENLHNFFKIKSTGFSATSVKILKLKENVIFLDNSSWLVTKVNQFSSLFDNYIGSQYNTFNAKIFKLNQVKYFEFQCTRYVFSEKEDTFAPITIEMANTIGRLRSEYKTGLTTEAAKSVSDLIGPNFISVIVPNLFIAYGEELRSYFYIYQMMCIWVYASFSYYYIGVIQAAVIIISATVKVYVRTTSEKKIKSLAEYKNIVTALRDNEWKSISTTELVSGDIIQISPNSQVPCDCVLLTGDVVVNESGLTGEPLPIRKFPLPANDNEQDVLYNPATSSKKNSLFSGTTVLQADGASNSGYLNQLYGNRAVALVLSTGSSTDKGQLVREILFPTPISFIFDIHLKVVVCLLLIWDATNISSWYYGIFIISEIMSPLIPAALVVGQTVAASRLRSKNIFCINLSRIIVSGKVRIFCFDKTGTLTKEGLEFYGVKNKASDAKEFGEFVESSMSEKVGELMKFGLGTCHAVTSVNGTLVGNPVDIEMFSSTKWSISKVELSEDQHFLNILQPNTKDEKVYKVLARHEFDHARSTMSVIVKDPSTNHCHAFVKGSFEKIMDICAEETIPANYIKTAESYATEGCYVLAMAHKDLGLVETEEALLALKSLERDSIENDVNLLGLILFKNKIRDDTRESIKHLREGGCRNVMITGDNALTGIHIAKAADMLNQNSKIYLAEMVVDEELGGKKKFEEDETLTEIHYKLIWTNIETGKVEVDIDHILKKTDNVELAMTGKAFDRLCDTGEIRKYLLDTRIFARMTPFGKVQCVELFMEHGVTAMCGDGGNDCGALRAAHVGVALSEAEASIVAPFSSKTRSIASCVELLKEGRNALANSFASYKFLILYGTTMVSLEMIQFYYSVICAQYVWIAIDSLITILLSWTVTLAKPAERLSKDRPTARLLGLQTVASIVGQFIINIIFIVVAFVTLYKQPFFKCHEFDASASNIALWWLLGDNYEAAVLGLMVLFQFINSAATVNFGYKFRASWYKNYTLVIVYFLEMAFVCFLVLAGPNPVGCFFRINCGSVNILEKEFNIKPYWEIPQYNNIAGHNIIPEYFRTTLLILGLTNSLLNILFERLVVIGPIGEIFKKKFGVKNKEKEIELIKL
ncbi:hypothetical protein HDU92_002546 [Lobulomyces angularis]|nr:hypothetical protein HDU92_002546 [Lobulomyces angularis]